MPKDEIVNIPQKTNAASSLSFINALSNLSFKYLIWIWVVMCLISLSLYLFWMSSRQKSKTTKVKTHGFRFVLFCSVLFIDSAWCPSLVSSTLTTVQDLNVPAVMEQEDFSAAVENGLDLPTCRNEVTQLNIQLKEKDLIFKNKLFKLFDTCRHFDLLAKDGDAFNKTMVVPSSSSSSSTLLLSNITEMNITKTKENSLCLLIYNFYNFDEQDKLEKKEYVNRNQRVLVGGQETKLARHLVEACPTFLYADDDALAGTDGYNVLTASCTMGSDMTVANGKTLKIKKDPSVVGEISIDRQATSGRNRHFNVYGNLEMEGVTLKGGYTVSSITSNILLLII